MNSFETPVLLLVFNRPEETKKVFEAVRKVAPKYIYIAADGPRDNQPGEFELCESVKKIVANIDWDCQVRTLFREKNIGCRNAVSSAITWFFEQEQEGIILEDDCLPDHSFFNYCELLLVKYRDDENIISIGGTNLGHKFDGDHSYAFSRFMNMWGWATWRRSANLVDYNMEKWKSLPFKSLFLHSRLQDNFLSYDYNWIKFWKNYFDLTAIGVMDTWDYQWIFTQLHYKKLSIFPAKNLIRNIGFANTATHTFNPDSVITRIPLRSLDFPLEEPKFKIVDSIYEHNFIKKIWFGYRKVPFYRIIKSNILNKPWILSTIRFIRRQKEKKYYE